MSTALTMTPATSFDMMTRRETSPLRSVGATSPTRETGLWASGRRVGRRFGRWLAKAAGWLSSPRGHLCLTVAGEALIAAGTLSRATVSDALDAVSLAATPFAPSAASRREGPRVIWG